MVQADLLEGSQTFAVSAVLPVVESFDLVEEMRKQTSGLARPQLLFSHWEVSEWHACSGERERRGRA